jgi:outer membrane cobalamin receptor
MNRSTRLQRCFAFLFLFVFFLWFPATHYALPAFAAQSTASIEGLLTDPSGAAVSRATVTLRSVPSSSDRWQTVSGDEGQFRFEVAPGRYRLSIEHGSFRRFEQEIELAPGEHRQIRMRLAIETLSASVVVSAEAQPIAATAASELVTVLTRQDISARQELWLAPMLQGGGGVNVAREGPFGGLTTLFLDGGNSNFTKVLIDGAPANQPGGDIDFEGLDLENVDKIEIVHGASSALLGSDAMTGVVQVFSHRGTTSTPALVLKGEGGTFQSGDGSGQLSGLLGAFDYSASSSYFSTAGQGLNDYFRNAALSGNFGWRFSENDQMRLSLRNDSNDAGQPGQTLLVPPTPDDHFNQHDFFSSFTWDFSTGEHWKHSLVATDSYIRQFLDDSFFAFSTLNRFYRTGLDARSSYSFANGGVSLGYEYEVENGEVGGPPHVRRNNQAGYTELRYQIGKRISATAGTRAEDNASFGTRVVPRVGGVYTLRFGRDFWGATRLRASYGLGIKEPTLVQSFDQSPCSPGNAGLRPERSTTVEVGIEQTLASDRIKFEVTYFHNIFHDIVSFAPDPSFPAFCGGFGGTFFNTDRARAFGANTSFEAKVTTWLRVTGNYAYDDTRVLAAPNAAFIDPTLEPGNRLLHRPLHSANLALNATVRRTNWNLAGTYVGRATDSDFMGLGITSNPAWLRWDLATILPLRYGLSVTARVENLFDRRYSDAVGYPALRLNYRIGLTYAWGGRQ